MAENTGQNPPSVFDESSPFKAIEYNAEELQFVYDQHGSDAEEVLAKSTAAFLNEMPEYRGTANYQDLLSGDAAILDRVPLPPEERGKGVTDDQILRLFSTLKTLGEDGAPTTTDAYLRGLTRGTFSLGAGVIGAKTAATAAPPYVPLPGPLAPLGVLSKPVAGLAGFIGGSIIGDAFLGTPVSNQLFTGLDSTLLTPQAEASFRAYESAGNVTPFIAMPMLAPKSIFSTAASLKKLPLANRVTVLSAEDMANPLITQYLAGKLSGVPTRRTFITLRDKIFREAKEAGQDITLKEAGKQAATELNKAGAITRGTVGAFAYAEQALVSGGQSFRGLSLPAKSAVVGAESLAIPATGALVSAQETGFPRSPGMRVGAETIGSLAPSVSLLRFLPKIYTGTKAFFTRMRENKALGQPLDVLGFQERAKGRAIEDIFELFEEHGQDPDAYLKAMEELLVDPVVENGKIVSYKLKPAFAPKEGDSKTQMFSGQFIENPAIAQLEQTVLGRSGGVLSGQYGADFIKSMEMMKGNIFALKGTGDPQLMKIAAQMMQDRISILIGMRTDAAVNATIKAVQKIYPDGGPDASKLLGERLNQVVKTQKDLFRRLEANAWSKIDRNQEVPIFYRFDEETQEFVENPVPNFIEEWDTTLSQMDKSEIELLLKAPGMKELSNRIDELREQIRLGSPPTRPTPPAVIRFTEEFDEAEGLPIRQSFLNVLERNGIIGTTVQSRVDELSGQVSEGALASFNQRIRLNQARSGSGLDINDVDQLRTTANRNDSLAEREMALYNQDPEAGASFKETADRLREEANLFRARADDLENPVATDTPTTLDDLVADEATIEQLGTLESRLGGRRNRNDPIVKLIRLKRLALIAERDAVRAAENAVPAEVQPITQGNLTAIYSIARQVAKEQSPVNSNFVRIANNLAEAALDDLNAGPYGNPAYDAARDISYAYNTYLKRAFGGEIISKNSRGKDVVNDALLTDKLMSGRPDALALKIDEIQKLGREVRKYAADSGYEIVTKKEVSDYMGTTDEVLFDTLRLALKEIELPIEARTMRTPEAIAAAQNEAMQQFRVKNPRIFETFPQLGQMMDEAGDAATFLRRLKGIPGSDTQIGVIKRIQKRVKNQEAFVKLIGAENPERAILKAINSENPTQELNSLVELIKAADNPRNLRRLLRNKNLNISVEALDLEAAKEGVRHSVLSLAFSEGGSYSVAGMNAKGAYNMLFDALPKARRDSETLSQWMISNNIMTEKEVSGLELGLRTIIKAETKQDVSQAIITGETPALTDFYTRILGSRLGTGMGSMMPGGRSGAAGLIEAEAGSRYLRQLTQEVPALQEYDALERILLDPELLALALRKPRSPAEKQGIINIMLDKLGTFGIGIAPAAGQRAIPLGAQEFVEPEATTDITLPEEPVVEPVSSVAPTAMPTPPPVPAQRVEPPAATLASVSPQTPAPSGNVDRTRYAAMFPNDVASGLIRQQGIGSLMG